MFFRTILFGDPSLVLRTAEPGIMQVSHGTLACNQTSFDVEVEGADSALCVLYADGAIYGMAPTDQNGEATINIGSSLPEGRHVILTITSFNMNAYIDTLWFDTDGDGVMDPLR